MNTRTYIQRALVAAGGAAALTVAVAGTAAAHVSVTPTDTAAGSHSILAFSVPHGCEESATTRLTITIPDSIASATPTVNPNWDIDTAVGQVVYTAKTPLPHDLRDTIELAVTLPDSEPGEVLAFPLVQTCEQGESAWVEIAADGQDPHELDFPAPAFALTAAATAEDAATDAVEPVASQADDDGGSRGLAVAALVVAVLGLVAASMALVRTRRA